MTVLTMRLKVPEATASNLVAGRKSTHHIPPETIMRMTFPGENAPESSRGKGPLQKPPLSEAPLQKPPLPQNDAQLHSFSAEEGAFPEGGLHKGPLQEPPLPEPPLQKAPLQKPPSTTLLLNESTLDRARVRTHARTRGFVVADYIDPYTIKKQQQQQPTRVDRDPARTREARDVDAGGYPLEKAFQLEEAFQLAGIKSPTSQRIPGSWKKATGKNLTAEDVLAWHFYRESENLNLPAGRQLRPAYVIANLEKGERVEEKFYARAREYLAELAAGDEDNAPEPIAPEIAALHRALEAYLPPVSEIGLEALDALRTRLPDIARGLLASGITADDLADLRLYLTYMDQPIPPPQDVARALEQVGREFDAWRKRTVKAKQLWRHILLQDGLAIPGSAMAQAMRRATPVDLNGALVVMADPDLSIYFDRIWKRHGPGILASANYPEDFPIRFIQQKKATEIAEFQ